MSNLPLNNIQEIVERSIYSIITQECIDKGYTPDIFDTVTYADDEQGQLKLEEAKRVIIADKGFTIGIYNNSDVPSKGYKKSPRIVILSENFAIGQIGAGAMGYNPNEVAEGDNPEFSLVEFPAHLHDFSFKVHILSDNVKQERILNSIIANSLPSLGYIDVFGSTTKEKFFIRNTSFMDLGFLSQEIMEKVYRYIIGDIYLTYDTIINPKVAGLNEITIEPMISTKGTSQMNNDSVSIIISDIIIPEEVISE